MVWHSDMFIFNTDSFHMKNVTDSKLLARVFCKLRNFWFKCQQVWFLLAIFWSNFWNRERVWASSFRNMWSLYWYWCKVRLQDESMFNLWWEGSGDEDWTNTLWVVLTGNLSHSPNGSGYYFFLILYTWWREKQDMKSLHNWYSNWNFEIFLLMWRPRTCGVFLWL